VFGSKPVAGLPPVITTTIFAAPIRVSPNVLSMIFCSPTLVCVAPPEYGILPIALVMSVTDGFVSKSNTSTAPSENVVTLVRKLPAGMGPADRYVRSTRSAANGSTSLVKLGSVTDCELSMRMIKSSS
jgi:hypothetical protein